MGESSQLGKGCKQTAWPPLPHPTAYPGWERMDREGPGGWKDEGPGRTRCKEGRRTDTRQMGARRAGGGSQPGRVPGSGNSDRQTRVRERMGGKGVGRLGTDVGAGPGKGQTDRLRAWGWGRRDRQTEGGRGGRTEGICRIGGQMDGGTAVQCGWQGQGQAEGARWRPARGGGG